MHRTANPKIHSQHMVSASAVPEGLHVLQGCRAVVARVTAKLRRWRGQAGRTFYRTDFCIESDTRMHDGNNFVKNFHSCRIPWIEWIRCRPPRRCCRALRLALAAHSVCMSWLPGSRCVVAVAGAVAARSPSNGLLPPSRAI